MAIAAQSQQLHPNTTCGGQALLVGLCRSLRVSRSRFRQTELPRAQAKGLTQMLLHVGAVARGVAGL